MKVGFLRMDKKPGALARSLFALASQYGIEFFYFTPENIDIEKKVINGLFWDNGDYIYKETPYPEIIDDQYSFRYQYKNMYNDLLQTSLFVYTPLGGKDILYNILKKSEYSKYLIETFNYKNADINELLQKYNRLIIKPNRGNKGKNIFSLHKDENFYYLQLENKILQINEEEYKQEYTSKFNDNYIVQPYINSTVKDGNALNIRLLVLRGKNGKWTTRRMTPRIARMNTIAENLNLGSSLAYHEDFFPVEFGDGWRKIYNELIKISMHVPDIIQKSYTALFDSFGFDIGVDRSNDNELKIFEINTFPGPRPFIFEVAEAKSQYYMYLFNRINTRTNA